MAGWRDWLGWLTGGSAPVQPQPTRRTPPAPSGPVPIIPAPHLPPPSTSATSVEKIDFDAGEFQPIERGELKAGVAAEGRPTWGNNPWFGRRDLIPPADDVRTKLVDRALVTHGLLTSEQLADIHRVGAQYQLLRPTLEGIQNRAAVAGAAAVEADRAARKAIKEQKKAEAAERRRQRSEAIAQRKATDIVYLGRGVSGRLHQRTSDARRLKSLGLPAVATPADVAAVLGLSVSKLRWLAYHSEATARIHYVTFTVPKRSGGVRTLAAPHRTLAAAQQWIFDNILKNLPVDDAAHGFVSGRSVLTNAAPHVGKAVVVNADLEEFFPSISFVRVRSVFQRLGYSPAAATVFALLCTESPRRLVEFDGKPYWAAAGPRGLPQGACTSPALSNQVARRLDKRLGGLAAKMNLAYTRYADDLTFSGGDEFAPRVAYLLARLRHIAGEEGFAVNEKKTRVLRRSARQQVTGVVVNEKLSLPRDELRRLRAILHRAGHEGLAAQNREGRSDFRAWLEGKIAYVRMVRPEVGERLQERFKALG